MDEPDQTDGGQWPRIAKAWRQLGSPLRPVDEDIRFFQAAIDSWQRHACAPARALILGVTPELFHLSWPDNTTLRAVDRTGEMIEHVWPGARSQVVQTGWTEMQWPDSGFDLVLCDGGLHLLDYPAGQQRLAAILARIIAPGGRFIIRLFVPPPQRETPEDVMGQLFNGRVPDLNCLKLRLGMALSAALEDGVSLHAVWQYLRDAGGDWPGLAARLNWDLEHLQAIDAYRGSGARYYFLSASQVEALFCGVADGAFDLEASNTPAYPMGGQCPTLVFRRAGHRPAGHE